MPYRLEGYMQNLLAQPKNHLYIQYFFCLMFQSMCQNGENELCCFSLSLIFFGGEGIRLPENELRFSMSPPPMPISSFVKQAKSFPFQPCPLSVRKSDQMIRLIRYPSCQYSSCTRKKLVCSICNLKSERKTVCYICYLNSVRKFRQQTSSQLQEHFMLGAKLDP